MFPAAFLNGFRGYLQTDGYAGYNAVEGAIHVGCWAHVRRKFDEALRAVPKGKRSPTAEQGVAYCSQLFKLEEKFKDLSPEERKKIEWAIGSVIAGDSVDIQKFIVLYGSAGTGKSTVLNIIQQLFDGYFTVFEAKALASRNNAFALEQFRSNPLVAIQHDGDLSKIEDNTRINSLVSHEMMIVNEKFKSAYSSQFKSFLFFSKFQICLCL